MRLVLNKLTIFLFTVIILAGVLALLYLWLTEGISPALIALFAVLEPFYIF